MNRNPLCSKGSSIQPRRQIPATLFGLAATVAVALGMSGCEGVKFYEKEHLADPIMDLHDDPTETHFFQKVYYSREGSAGGIGTTAGGGCGCY